jgi:hypothetical protein
MSSTVQILIKDDIDGSMADETLQFMLDGTTYEIDLSKRNATALRQAMARYIKAARRVRGAAAVSAGRPSQKTPARRAAAHGKKVAKKRPGTAGKAARGQGSRIGTQGARRRTTATASARVRSASGTGASPAAVREWARRQGLAVSERGRVSADLVAKYELARRG